MAEAVEEGEMVQGPILEDIMLPPMYANLEFWHNMKEYSFDRETDVMVTAYPRSGTTLTSQIVSLLVSKPAELQQRNDIAIYDRVSFIDQGKPAYMKFCEMAPPRLLKTHLPFKLTERWVKENKVKTVVCIRNPKDALVSYYHFHTAHPVLGPYKGSWSQFFESVMTEKIVYGDVVDWVCEWWKNRNEPNVCLVKYEDLVCDKLNQIKKIADFLECKFDDVALQKVQELSSFDSMRESDSTNYKGLLKPEDMIRKGKIGEWKKYFTVAQNDRFDAKYQNQMKEAGLEFQFE